MPVMNRPTIRLGYETASAVQVTPITKPIILTNTTDETPIQT